MTVVKARWKTRLRWALGILFIFILLVTVVWNGSLLSQAPKMLDKELAFANEDGLPLSVQELRTKIAVDPKDNAGPMLKQAFAGIKKWKDTDEGKAVLKVTGSLQSVGSLKPADIERVGPAIAGHTEIFSLLEQAATKPKVDFEIRYEEGSAATYPGLEMERTSVALLAIRARYEEQQGKIAEALATLDLAAKQGRLACSDPSLIGLLVGSAVRSFVCDAVAILLKQNGSREDFLKSARHVLEDIGGIPDISKSLQAEFALGRVTIARLRNAKLSPEAFGSERLSRLMALARFGPVGSAYELRYVQTFRSMYEGMLRTRGSILQMHKVFSQVQHDLEVNAKHDWTYSLTDLMSPVYEGVPLALGEAEAKRRVLLAAIDLLEELHAKGPRARFIAGTSPDWMDPFTEKPLIVHTRPGGFIVYSVGRDEKDNGGKQRPKNSSSDGYDIPFSYPK